MGNVQLILSPYEAHEAEQKYRIVKRSVDARQRELKVLLTILVDEQGRKVEREAPIPLYEPPHFQDVHNAEHSAVIVGAGPAGLFAALTLLEHGIRPVLYERGVENGILKKSGSFYSYGDTKIGQGRDNVKKLLRENPDLMDELEAKIMETIKQK